MAKFVPQDRLDALHQHLTRVLETLRVAGNHVVDGDLPAAMLRVGVATQALQGIVEELENYTNNK